MPSPYEVVLGERVADLDPRIRAYVAELPAGRVGRGRGVFRVAGTERVWMRPLVAVVGRGGAMFGTSGREVPFTVDNRAASSGSARAAIRAVRCFAFRDGRREMHDLIAVVPGPDGPRLVDLIGSRRTILAVLAAEVRQGGLSLRSTAVHLRLGPLRIRIPGAVSPRVTLDERTGPDGRQFVDLEVRMPVIGRVYGYRGSFDYRIEEDR